MSVRLLFVGQAPSRRSDPAVPLSGASGRRLAGLLGLTLEEFLAQHDRVNLLQVYPGKAGKGDAFSWNEARSTLTLDAHGRRVVLLGQGVAHALGLKRLGLMLPEWIYLVHSTGLPGGPTTAEFTAATFPHPSGVSRWWNAPGNETRAREFLRWYASTEVLR